MDLNVLFEDRPLQPGEQDPCDKGLDILSQGHHMYGIALLPSSMPGQNHPCVVMLHGLPGHTTNQDVSQALRRLGFAVLHPFYRGAWGSQGWFSLSGMIQDVKAIAQWCRSREASEQYGIDGERVFLVGISMGGWAAIHGLSDCDNVVGAVAIAPADIVFLGEERPALFKNAYQKYGCLRLESPEILSREAAQYRDELGMFSQLDKLKDRPLLVIGGSRDTVIPPADALQPFWEAMESRGLVGDKEFVILDANHSFAACRGELTRRIALWLLNRMDPC